MSEVELSPDGERALREAEAFCSRTNVAIIAPEHLLAGALLVVGASRPAGLPDAATLTAAVQAAQGAGEPLAAKVMWGSSARAALTITVAAARKASATTVTAADLARGVIASGELMPGFFDALGTTKTDLLRTLVAVR